MEQQYREMQAVVEELQDELAERDERLAALEQEGAATPYEHANVSEAGGSSVAVRPSHGMLPAAIVWRMLEGWHCWRSWARMAAPKLLVAVRTCRWSCAPGTTSWCSCAAGWMRRRRSCSTRR